MIEEFGRRSFLSKCVEIIEISGRPEQEDEFLSIEKVRFAEMRKKNAHLERRIFKVPFAAHTYAVCTTWQCLEEAVRYAGERFQRDRFHRFLCNIVESISIRFVEELELDSLEGVDDSILSKYSG